MQDRAKKSKPRTNGSTVVAKHTGGGVAAKTAGGDAAPHGAAPKAAKPRASGAGTWGNAVPSQQESNALKRNSIISAAAQCFNRSGFHGTSMDDIAGRLGVTKPALYRYVKNKHEVLFACFTMVMDMSFQHVERGERSGGSGLEKLQFTLRGYLTDLMTELGHPVVLLEEGALLPDQLRVLIGRRDELEQRYRAMVDEGIRDGSVIPCNAKLAVFALFGAINWVPKWYREDGEWSAAYVAETLTHLITRGLAADPEGPRAEDSAARPARVPIRKAKTETRHA